MTLSKPRVLDHQQHEQRWKNLETLNEYKQLKRELEHLQKKSQSRLLTIWEMERLREISCDAAKLVDNCFQAEESLAA